MPEGSTRCPSTPHRRRAANQVSDCESKNLELAGLQLQNHRPRNPRFLARGRPDLFCKPPDHHVGIAKKHILLKGVLRGYGLGRTVRHNRSLVDTTGEFVQARTVPAELALKCLQTQLPQIADCLYAELGQFLLGDFADAGQPTNRHRQQKRIDLLWLNYK